MVKCVCERACQVRKGKKIHTYMRGEVDEFESVPPHFRSLEEGKVDFATAGEEELLEAEFDLDELKDYIREVYGKNPRNRNKENTIRMLLDCRYRAVDAEAIKKEAEIQLEE